MKTEPLFRLPCWFVFSDHEWTDWDYVPCRKERHCIKCKKEERENGWHRFGNWGTPYAVKVYDSNNKTVEQDRQRRSCASCGWVDERVVLY